MNFIAGHLSGVKRYPTHRHAFIVFSLCDLFIVVFALWLLVVLCNAGGHRDAYRLCCSDAEAGSENISQSE